MSTPTWLISRRIWYTSGFVETIAQGGKDLDALKRRLVVVAAHQVELVLIPGVKLVSQAVQLGEQPASDGAGRGHGRGAVLEMRLAQDAGRPVRPGDDGVGAEIGEDARVGKPALLQVAGSRRHAGLDVEAELAQQEVQAVRGEMLEVARRDRLRAADPVRIALFKADKFNPIRLDPLFQVGDGFLRRS